MLAWLLPTALAIMQGRLEPGYQGTAILSDATVYSRYLVAIYIMIATERYADLRVRRLTEHFEKAGLLAGDTRARFDEILQLADSRSSAILPELVALVLAFVVSLLTTNFASEVAATSWEGVHGAGDGRLSWAGWSVALFSNVVFLFLAFRWAGRFAVWSAFMWRTAHLPLRLMPLHPDRSGGLGFLALFPAIFSGVVFAASTVISASFIKALHFVERDPVTAWYAVSVWVIIILIIFLGPLAFFIRPLYRLRAQALLEYARLAQAHHEAFEERWLGDDRRGKELLGSPDPSSASDLNGAIHTVQGLRVFPMDRLSLVELLVCTLAPFLALLLYQVPLVELLEFLVSEAI